MVSLAALWLPILLSAVLVFVVSSLLWTVLPWHKADFAGLPDEEAVRGALGSPELTPGQYQVPHAPEREAYDSEEMDRKFEEGPVAFVTVVPDGRPDMTRKFVGWFLYLVGVSVMTAYVAGRTLPPGAEYLDVFRVTGTVAWLAYGAAYVGDSVWFGRPWGFSAKMLTDALIYGLLTAGAFGWLWPA